MDIKKMLLDIYDQDKDRIYKIIAYILKNEELAEEVIHDTFVKAITHFPNLKRYDNLRAWIFKTAINQAYNIIKKEKRVFLVSNDYFESNEYSLEDNPLEFLTKKEQKTEIRQALRLLDPEACTIITLRYYCNLRLKEIGDLLEIPTGTVKSRLHRSLVQLRKYMIKNSHAKTSMKKGGAHEDGMGKCFTGSIK